MSGTASAAPLAPLRVVQNHTPASTTWRARSSTAVVMYHTTGRNLTRLAMRAAKAAGAHPDDLGAIDRAAAAWYARGGAQYHCHYLVGLSGRVFELAPSDRVAYHTASLGEVELAKAVPSWWRKRWPAVRHPLDLPSGRYPNNVSVSIDVLPDLEARYTDAQLDAAAYLAQALSAQYRIPLDRAHHLGHSDADSLAPGHGLEGLGPRLELDGLHAPAGEHRQGGGLMNPWAVVGLVTLVGGVILMAGSSSSSSKAPGPLASVQIPVPPGGLSEAELGRWAERIGVPLHQLLIAIVLGSERGTSLAVAVAWADELRAIAHTVYNRSRYPGAFGRTWWAIVVGDRARTGQQGTRPYATSLQGATTIGGEHAAYLLAIAREVEAQQRRGETLKGITHFHHHTGATKAQVDATWRARGYVEVQVPGSGAATFFAPGEAKRRALS
ncbi:MAG: N-acetylmuramoyl-L-alanine amidase [bacterium]